MRNFIFFVLFCLVANGCCNTPLDNVERIDWLSAQLKEQHEQVLADIEKFRNSPDFSEVVDFKKWDQIRQEMADVITYLKVRRRVVLGQPIFDPDREMNIKVFTSN